jgi:hypothetical protein
MLKGTPEGRIMLRQKQTPDYATLQAIVAQRGEKYARILSTKPEGNEEGQEGIEDEEESQEGIEDEEESQEGIEEESQEGIEEESQEGIEEDAMRNDNEVGFYRISSYIINIDILLYFALGPLRGPHISFTYTCWGITRQIFRRGP